MTAEMLLVGIASALMCIMLPGWGLKAILTARGMAFSTDPTASLLSCFALGVHVNALVFLAIWTVGSPQSPLLLAAIIAALAGLLFVTGTIHANVSVRAGPRRLQLFIAVGLAIGIFAAIRFPSTLDSLQILQVQQFMLGLDGGGAVSTSYLGQISALMFGGLSIPAQPGFGGIVFLPALLQPSMPVATVAAANKPIVFALAGVVSLYTAQRFHFRSATAAAALIFASVLLSQLGLYGLYSTGKDSAFAVVMALASISALVDANEDGNEPGLYMSSAILLGAISVPFLLVFWALFFVLSGGAVLRTAVRQAAWCIYPLVIGIVSVHTSFAAPGSFSLTLLPIMALGCVAVAILSFATKRVAFHGIKISDRVRFASAWLPAFLVAGIVMVMPVTGHVISGFENGAPVLTSPAPLNGATTAWNFLVDLYPTNNSWLLVAATLCLTVVPVLCDKFRSPFYVAFFSFLPATALIVLLHVRLGLHFLPDFNLWDISRDTAQWYMGAFGATTTLVGVFAIFLRSGWPQWIVVPAVVLIFAMGVVENYRTSLRVLGQSPMVTQSGGFPEPISAKAMDFAWREARNGFVYVSVDSPFNENFYSYQMFGPKLVSRFDPAVIGTEKAQTFFTNSSDLVTVLRGAEALRSSGYVQPAGGNAYMIKLTNDGRGQFDTRLVPETLVEISGAYAVEIAAGRHFRWAPKKIEIRVLRPLQTGGISCVELGFVNTWNDADLNIQVQSRTNQQIIEVPRNASLEKPYSANICIPLDNLSRASVELIASNSPRQFPDDARDISFGIIWPRD